MSRTFGVVTLIKSNRPWLEDTIVNVYSSTKTMMALVALVLSVRGEIDVYAPVAVIGPSLPPTVKTMETGIALACGGFVRARPGDSGKDLYDWEKIVSLLEQQRPCGAVSAATTQ